jgi:hypothetical protein
MPWGNPAFKFGDSSSHEIRDERPPDNTRPRNSSDRNVNSPTYRSTTPSHFQQVPLHPKPSIPRSVSTTFGNPPSTSSSNSANRMLTEDHDPNLANSRRVQGPPSVITTRPQRILTHTRLKRPHTSPSKHVFSRDRSNPYKNGT